MRILAIVGSLREDSYNLQLAKQAEKILNGRIDFEILDYRDVPLFNEDYENPEPESVKKVREKVDIADGIWFFTPEYNRSYPGVLKNLIDWLSRPIKGREVPLLTYKPAAISGITRGSIGTAVAQDKLVALLSLLNMRVMNVPRLTIGNASKQMDESGKIKLSTSLKYLEKQALSFIEFIEKEKLIK